MLVARTHYNLQALGPWSPPSFQLYTALPSPPQPDHLKASSHQHEATPSSRAQAESAPPPGLLGLPSTLAARTSQSHPMPMPALGTGRNARLSLEHDSYHAATLPGSSSPLDSTGQFLLSHGLVSLVSSLLLSVFIGLGSFSFSVSPVGRQGNHHPLLPGRQRWGSYCFPGAPLGWV